MIKGVRRPVIYASGAFARCASILGLVLSIGVVALALALGPGFAGTRPGPTVAVHAVAFEGASLGGYPATYASLGGR